MQMPISQSAPAATQASASTQSGGASAKTQGSGEAPFVKKLVQTIAGGTTEGATSAQSGSDGAAKASVIGGPDLSAILGGNVTAANLLAVIEDLLKKLASPDNQGEDSGSATKDDLAEALKRLEELLGTLGIVPVLTTPRTDDAEAEVQSVVVAQQPESDPVTATATPDAPATQALAAAQPIVQALAVAQTLQQAGTVEQQAQPAVVEDVQEAVQALKSGLQEALVDLRSYLQQSKAAKSGPDTFSAIGKQLAVVEQLLEGKQGKEEAVIQQNVPLPHADEVADTIRSWQSASNSNTHLQRMANQVLHTGMLSVIPRKEKTSADESPVQELPDLAGTEVQASAGQDMQLQRQLQTLRPVIPQPVPVQQFAETMQNLVVKQFDLSSAGGVSEARITLFPEHLGQVDVKITVHNGMLTAMFLTDTSSAKDLLENQMAQLRVSLQSQGLQIDKLEVSQASVQPNLLQDRQGNGGRDQQSGKRNKSKDDTVGGISGFESDLEEIQIEQAVDRRMGLGRTIHTTA